MNTPHSRDHVADLYGESVVIVDYVVPGFALARRCAEEFWARCRDETIAIVLMHHGIFSFGHTARESYDRMIERVTRAEEYLRRHSAWQHATIAPPPSGSPRRELAQLRAEISSIVGAPTIVQRTMTHRVAAFLRREDYPDLAHAGR
jgi:rhamnose utilization protein RhaD (predicted bifunctional aldolase and dehydrogenase)